MARPVQALAAFLFINAPHVAPRFRIPLPQKVPISMVKRDVIHGIPSNADDSIRFSEIEVALIRAQQRWQKRIDDLGRIPIEHRDDAYEKNRDEEILRLVEEEIGPDHQATSFFVQQLKLQDFDARLGMWYDRVNQEKNNASENDETEPSFIPPSLSITDSRPLLSHEETLALCESVRTLAVWDRAIEYLTELLGRSVTDDEIADRLGFHNVTDYKRRRNTFRVSKDRLVYHNMGLVTKVAKGYKGYGLAMDDLIQEGTLGLMKAIERFDPSRGFRFSTYATPWIRQGVSRAVQNQGKTIRIPNDMYRQVLKYRKVRSELRYMGLEATTENLAERMGCSVKRLQRIQEATRVFSLSSLDSPVSHVDDRTLGDMLSKSTGDREETNLGELLDTVGNRKRIDMYRKVQKYKRVREELEHMGLEATTERLAERMRVSIKMVQRVQEAAELFSLSMDSPVSQTSGRTLEDMISKRGGDVQKTILAELDTVN